MLFFSSCDSITSSHVDCDFRLANFWVVGIKYSCEVKNNPQIYIPESALIDNITGIHQNDKSNDDVTFFRADNKGIKYFPQGLELFLPNIKGIVVGINKIKEIRSSELKSYPNLTYLNFGQNSIEVLEDGLFDHNPNLEILVFQTNKIVHIGMDLFSSLPKLTSLSLEKNICINLRAQQNSTAVQTILDKITTQCMNFEYLNLNRKIGSIEANFENFNYGKKSEWENKILNLACEINSSNFSHLTSFKERTQKLKYQTINNILNFDTKLDKVEKDLMLVNLKIETLEKRLMEKIEEVLLENVGTILKAINDAN